MPFQTSVSTQPAPAVAGDFANGNPRFAVPAGPGGLIAGAAGVTIGQAPWPATANWPVATRPSTKAEPEAVRRTHPRLDGTEVNHLKAFGLERGARREEAEAVMIKQI